MTAFTTRPELAGTFGAVASTHWLASQSGMAVLELGGNAFDAAVAAGFVLQVVEPHLNGPGGEVPILIATTGSEQATVLCGQGVAPAAAGVDAFEHLGLDLVPGTGLLAATVPGAVGAWLTLLRDHGTLPLATVLRYAIGYAGAGHPLVGSAARTIAAVADHFRAHWPTSAATWLDPDGHAPEPGRLFRNPTLAATYQALVDAGQGLPREAAIDAAIDAWYNGFVAGAIDAWCRTPVRDDSGRDHAGLLTGDDLARWTPTYEQPATTDWRGWTVAKAGAWSQGPSFLQALRILDGAAADTLDGDLVHTAVETVKLAMADREAWYGDVADVPLATLLSTAYANVRRERIGDHASLELRPGSPDGRTPRLPRHVTDPSTVERGTTAGVGEPTVARVGEQVTQPDGTTRGDTCHLDVADRFGNIVSATPSGGWLQSSPVIPDLGFALGTRAQMFWLDRGLPNSIAPGKRPRTTLTPTLARHHDTGRWLAFGTPGGDQQEQWQLCFWLAHTARGLDLQAAIDAPTWHTTAFPSSFYPRETNVGEVVVESRVGTEVIAELRRRGHTVVVTDPWSLGRLSAVSTDPGTGLIRAAANARGMQGYAVAR